MYSNLRLKMNMMCPYPTDIKEREVEQFFFQKSLIITQFIWHQIHNLYT